MNKTYISINNEIYASEDAKISVTDLAVQRGFGIFDFLKTINHQPIFVEDHLDRLFNSAKEMNLAIGFTRMELLTAIDRLIEKNNMPNSGIKIIVTGGFSPDGYTMVKPNLIITQTEFQIDEAKFEQGMKLVTYNHQRQLPHIKTIDYLQAIRLNSFIKDSNADDVLYHYNSNVCECPRANFFIVTENEVITPKSNILKGITRKKILALNLKNYTLVERDFTLEDIAQAKEAFVSSSTKNAFPVIAVDGKKIGNGLPGKVTREINEQLRGLIRMAQMPTA